MEMKMIQHAIQSTRILGLHNIADQADAELVAIGEEFNHRFVRCTFCDWSFPYRIDAATQAREEANAHAAKCEADPRNKELERLREQVKAKDVIVQAFLQVASPDGFVQHLNYEYCPECEGETTHKANCQLAEVLKGSS